MMSYIDLSSIIDIEPSVNNVLDLVTNEQLADYIVDNKVLPEFIFLILNKISDEEFIEIKDSLIKYLSKCNK